jgi:hypothetical protein
MPFNGNRDANGFILGTDPAKTQKNDQTFSIFNGRLDNEAVRVNPGDLVRLYFVNVGPGTSAAHVIGAVLDRVYDGQTQVRGLVQKVAENLPTVAAVCDRRL